MSFQCLAPLPGVRLTLTTYISHTAILIAKANPCAIPINLTMSNPVIECTNPTTTVWVETESILGKGNFNINRLNVSFYRFQLLACRYRLSWSISFDVGINRIFLNRMRIDYSSSCSRLSILENARFAIPNVIRVYPI